MQAVDDLLLTDRGAFVFYDFPSVDLLRGVIAGVLVTLAYFASLH